MSGSGGADLSFPVAAHPLPGFHRPIMRVATSGDRRGPFKTAPVKLARPVCKTVPASGKLRGKPRWSHADQQDRPGGPGTGERAEISGGTDRPARRVRDPGRDAAPDPQPGDAESPG